MTEFKLNDKKRAFLAGIFILVAYAVLASSVTDNKITIASFEVISGLAVIGIPIMFFTYFKDYNKKISYLYTGLKFVEGGLMVIAGFLVLSKTSAFTEVRDQIYEIHFYIFVVSAFLLYYLLYGTQILPKWLSVWGMVAVVLILTVNTITQMEIEFPILLMGLGFIQIVLNEVVMAFLLMVKGFNRTLS